MKNSLKVTEIVVGEGGVSGDEGRPGWSQNACCLVGNVFEVMVHGVLVGD